MKKFIYILAVAGLALVSCSKNNEVNLEDSDLVPVVYQPAAKISATKATGRVTGTELDKDTDSFVSMAYYHKEGVETAEYINAQKVWWHDEMWYTEEAYYWPQSTQATLSFYSYHPYELLDEGVVAYDPDKKYGLSIESYDVETYPDYDLMFADKIEGASKTKTSGYVTNGVPAAFHHLLSCIDSINVKLDAEYSTAEITVDKISLVSMKHKGAFADSTWTVDEDVVAEKVISKDDAVTVSTEYTRATKDDYYFVLPQDSEESLQGIKIEYTVNTGKVSETLSPTIYFKNIIDGFEMSKAYTFNLIIGLNIIKWDTPTVNDWTTSTSSVTVE